MILKNSIILNINGEKHALEVSPGETLLDTLRERLSMTGTKNGCGEGDCGACIVIKNGETINSCLELTMGCEGAEITTVEGVAPSPDKLHPLQEAFINHGAIQCGFCTPGMLMSAKNLLDTNANPSRDEIKMAISGNICRCTGYKKLVNAIESTAQGIINPSEQVGSPIGKSAIRSDAIEHVTGSSIFGEDIQRPGMVYGKILRSRYAHAQIISIDTSAAESLEGVLAVVTGQDIPEGYFGVDIKDRLAFARDKVRYRGDEIAAVAATSEEIAEQAINLIDVKYKPLEPVFDMEEAMLASAPIIHEKNDEYDSSFTTERMGNICTVASVKLGNLEKGFADSDVVLEEQYGTQIQYQAALENHVALAEVDIHGRIIVWTSTQKPFAIRRYLSESLKIPINQIRVIATKIGGGFGSKLEMHMEPYAVLLAMKCNRPVQIVFSREEDFLATTPRHQARFWVKSGVKKDGTLVARQIKLIYDTGAYSGNGPTAVTLSSQVAGGLYRTPNLQIDGYCVYTNKMNSGSMRGPSAPQTTFAMESHMDSLAKAIGMDPIDFRMKNLLEKGEKTAVGQVLVDTDFKLVLEQAANAIGWKKLKREKNVGKGIACAFWLSGGWATSATVKVNEDGTISLITGAVDMGTGYLYTSVPQMVAEVLGIKPEDVNIVQADTDNVSYDHGIGGSRGTFTVGKGAQMAALKARDELFNEAAKKLKIDHEDLETKNGWIFPKDSPETRISFAEISYGCHIKKGGPVAGSSYYLPEMDPIDESRVKGLTFSAFKGNTIACHAAVVRVIPETGEVKVEKYVAAHDVGKAINPMGVEGQIEGGVAMGLGFALTEQVIMGKNGEVLNPNYHDYKLLTSMDVPETEPIIVEVPSSYGPYGAKGIGEPTAAPSAAVIGNAIFDATGVRMHGTPMTPERVREAINKKIR